MGTFFNTMGGGLRNIGHNPLTFFTGGGTMQKSDYGMHPSELWQRQGGPTLNSGPWSGVAPSLAGAQAGYTPQSYSAAAGKAGLLNPNQPPGS
jgi:hypothetical protein